MARVPLVVGGVRRPRCESAMRSFLRREAGVQEVNVSCETGSARVECDEAVTSPDKVVSAPVFRGSFDAAVGE